MHEWMYENIWTRIRMSWQSRVAWSAKAVYKMWGQGFESVCATEVFRGKQKCNIWHY